MARTIQITIPPEKTDDLLTEIRQISGLISLRVQRGISIHPPGDVITIESTNQSLNEFMLLLDNQEMGRRDNQSFTTSEPLSVISASMTPAIVHDSSESTWEEMEQLIGKESNMTVNAMMIMATAGIVATFGIATNALHIVIGAMVIAPGFEPISRFALGLAAKSSAWKRGLTNTALSYMALLGGVVIATLILQAMDKNPLAGEATYLPKGVLVSYWTSITAPSLIISAVSGIAGSLLIATNRSVLTGGVMIALALVPAATIAGMALVSWQINLFLISSLRWLLDAALVAIFSALVFYWKRHQIQQRDMFF